MSDIPKVMWAYIAGENYPLTTEAQITAAIEALRMAQWDSTTVYCTPGQGGKTIGIAGRLYSDVGLDLM